MNQTILNQGLALRTMAPDTCRAQQDILLQNHIRQAMQGSHYKKLYQDCGVTPEDISLANLGDLPLTSRADLNGNSRQFQAVSDAQIRDLSLTSGTTGSPVRIPYTHHDLDRLAYNEAMAFYGAGVRPGDVYIVGVTLDRCFIAGLAYYSGLVTLGATAVRSGPGQPARQWECIEQLKPKGIIGVPSFLLQIGQWVQEHGYNPAESSIESLITIGEPIRRGDFELTPLGRDLQQIWQTPIHASYGATELETGISECCAQRGGHIHPELMIAEIVDEQGKLVPQGEAGELVVTPLGVEGFPLVRFRTGDITRMHTGPCDCGWTSPRIGPIEGRLAQRLKVKGTTIYPDTILQLLQEIPNLGPAYLEVSAAYDLSDEIKVVVAEENAINVKEIMTLLQARLRVRPEVEKQPAEAIMARMSEGHKVKRFFDNRS
jgi:phenylacetate-CoA ligase